MTGGRPVVVVGAGLAGLRCAARLHREGRQVVVLEAGDDVGGRVRTDVVDGFTVDRGFQVLNTAYPALGWAVDLGALNLRHLPRGVRVRRGGELHDVPHPLSSVTAPLTALTSRVTGPRGKLALARYTGRLLVSSAAGLKRRPDLPAGEAWAQALPADVVDDVLVPFLSGVVLEEEITTSRVFTDLMMRMFATGSSAVPAAGMVALPRALARNLPPGAVRLGTAAAEVAAGSVVLVDGSEVEAEAVVVATDPWTAHELLPELGPPPRANGVTTFYFAADPWKGLDGKLVVDADGSGITSSVVISDAAPEYSTDGRALVATSVLTGRGGAEPDIADVRRHAALLHDAPDDDWELVATCPVPHALPAMPAPLQLRKPVHVPEAGVWVTGDHRDTSSLQGALVSGNRAAAAVLRSLRPS